MDVNEEWMAVEQLADLLATNPRRVIIETWRAVEQALRRAFAKLAYSEENRLVPSRTLLGAIRETKELDPEIVASLEALLEHKEKVSGRAHAEDAGPEDVLRPIAEACAGSARRVLRYMADYTPRRRYKGARRRPEESGLRKERALGGSPPVLIIGLVLAASVWLASFLLEGVARKPTTEAAPKPAAEHPLPDERKKNLLGYWRRPDGLVLRIESHPKRQDRFVGFVVKTPSASPTEDLRPGDPVLVVDADAGGRCRGYQKIVGTADRWRFIEFAIGNHRIEADGGAFERLVERPGDGTAAGDASGEPGPKN